MTAPSPQTGSSPTEFSHVELRSAYADSVTLLQVSRGVAELPGVISAQVAMATPLNLEVLASMGFQVPSNASVNDMVVALRLTGADQLVSALAGVESVLAQANRRPSGSSTVAPPRTTGSALRLNPGGLVLISTPGASAVVEAVDALEAGSDVMIFSDNVPIAHEVALKQRAARDGLLVMGPDCGTAIVGGVGLGFANVVVPGAVGIVAASGTGAQQMLALLDHAGVGVGDVLGVGGRDLSAEVGALSTKQALARLDAAGLDLVVVLSKPAAAEVAAEVASQVAGMDTPVHLGVLGEGQPDLTATAEAVLATLQVPVPAWPVLGTARPSRGGTTLHGLYAGGTLAAEASIIAGPGHEIIDFGDDAYTTGRAHPMIDPTLRNERMLAVAGDPRTGVIVVDVVLGNAAEEDPAAVLAPLIGQIDVPVIVSLIGTTTDPQGWRRQADALVAAGAEVHLSNASAVRRGLELIA